MKRLSVLAFALLAVALGACSSMSSGPGWTVLFDGSNLDNWSAIGNANWRIAEGSVQADSGDKRQGYLVSKSSYSDFQVRAEFWVDDDANSGVFIRCTDPTLVNSKNAYEVNIFDKRPDPSYGTGAIVSVAKASTVLKAGGKWNTYEITAKGSHFTIVLNGVKTAEVDNSQHASGRIALQYGAGVVKFRKVEIRPL
jgi:3-keto-disaccharide hydrolase